MQISFLLFLKSAKNPLDDLEVLSLGCDFMATDSETSGAACSIFVFVRFIFVRSHVVMNFQDERNLEGLLMLLGKNVVKV